MTGYDVGSATLYNKAGKLRANEKETLSCQRCDKLLRDPMQLITCGCRYCKSCVKTIIGEMYASRIQPQTASSKMHNFIATTCFSHI